MSVACFSPKPCFVYKWWLYVKTGVWALFFIQQHHRHTRHKLLNCLVHCNINSVLLLQSKFKPFCISVWAQCAQINQICHVFLFKYCATWRRKANCIYGLQSIQTCRYVVKLYCECVNNNGHHFILFCWFFFFNTACIVEIKQYCTEEALLSFFQKVRLSFMGHLLGSHVSDVRQRVEELQGDVFGTPKVSRHRAGSQTGKFNHYLNSELTQLMLG